MLDFLHRQNSPERIIAQLKTELEPLFALHPEKEKIMGWLQNQRSDRGVQGLRGLKIKIEGLSPEQIAQKTSREIFEMLRLSRWN